MQKGLGNTTIPVVQGCESPFAELQRLQTMSEQTIIQDEINAKLKKFKFNGLWLF
jgi:hypothetical protein